MTGLRSDLHEVRMAASYLRRGMTGDATVSLFVRTLPVGRGFLVAAGLADCLAFLEAFRFTGDELDYLDSSGIDAVDLEDLRFTGGVRAVPEGRVVFAGEPLLEVTAPLPQAQLVGTALLNLVTFQTAVASKAARCAFAADGAELVEFAARRAHGPSAAMAVARASAIAGFDATGHLAAAHRYGLRAAGTVDHSAVLAFGDERAAFRAFIEDHPDAVLPVDTYDTLAGVRAAIESGRPAGVRLGSGDLGELSVRTRELLDAAGLHDTRIVVGGGLDEHGIAALVAAGAPIDVFGVGTRLGVCADAPLLDSACELVDYDGRPVAGPSRGRTTTPGAKQVHRGTAAEGDVLATRDEPVPAGREPLLVPVMTAGRRTGPVRTAAEAVADACECFRVDALWLPPETRQLRGARPVPVRLSHRLAALTTRVRENGGRTTE
ncbi:nicotinate phosphoribosyltransferase [Saccharothrix syringae]|uniref:Nicotinate phosphoribosyltransferase n=1 Tax=Saccharothrix syringae TaxID=103733 RepID=A0A5Q0H0H1_SACSY|nr:nicotinate phosphoribosyltransferase [Saccharothrix syringae]QFZ19669.1 nicotinate phosphoribosyltransferase [Saccharothrix syringae]